MAISQPEESSTPVHTPQCIIAVLRNYFCLLVSNGYDISLKVLEEVAGFIVVNNSTYMLLIIIHRDNGVASPRLPEDLAAIKCVS
ncbi:MAG: hypothetical protein KIC77_11485, partial [Clostridiales bacterium]|nr:hypothetical protein [Clostridiales bacterium]